MYRKKWSLMHPGFMPWRATRAKTSTLNWKQNGSQCSFWSSSPNESNFWAPSYHMGHHMLHHCAFQIVFRAAPHTRYYRNLNGIPPRHGPQWSGQYDSDMAAASRSLKYSTHSPSRSVPFASIYFQMLWNKQYFSVVSKNNNFINLFEFLIFMKYF